MNLIDAIKIAIAEKYGKELIVLAREEDHNDLAFRINKYPGISRIEIITYLEESVTVSVRFSTNSINFGKFKKHFGVIVGLIVDNIKLTEDKSGFISVFFEYPYLKNNKESIYALIEWLDEIFLEFNKIGELFKRLDAIDKLD